VSTPFFFVGPYGCLLLSLTVWFPVVQIHFFGFSVLHVNTYSIFFEPKYWFFSSTSRYILGVLHQSFALFSISCHLRPSFCVVIVSFLLLLWLADIAHGGNVFRRNCCWITLRRRVHLCPPNLYTHCITTGPETVTWV
jgi:hypothetical protein